MTDVAKLNHYAQMSCSKWNNSKNPNSWFCILFSQYFYGLSRRRFRAKYRNMIKKRWERPEYQNLIRYYKNGRKDLNTYPYDIVDFAYWPEDSNVNSYSLVSDQSGCVIRHSPSYVAWKIFEETGEWPQKKTKDRLDAKRWKQFLYEAGYEQVATYLKTGHHYVGINPKDGEFGIVVWFEERDPDGAEWVKISTYRNGSHVFSSVRKEDYEWIQIN